MMANYTGSSKSSRDMKSIAWDGTEGVQQSQSCRHFSIRGYASKIRKINRNICWPFGNSKCEELPDLQLPPMIIPEFKWWACESCRWKINRIESAPVNSLFPNSHNLKTSDRNKDGLISDGELSPIEGEEANEEHQAVHSGMEITETDLLVKSRDDDDVAVGLDDLSRSNKSNVDSLKGVKSDGIRSNSCKSGNLMSKGQLSPIDEDEQENEGNRECNLQVVLPGIDIIETNLYGKPRSDDEMAEGLNDQMRSNKSAVDVLEGVENDGIWSYSGHDLMSERHLSPIEKTQEEREEQTGCNIQVVLPCIEFIETQLSTIARGADLAAEGSDNLMKPKVSNVNVKGGIKNDGIPNSSCRSGEFMSEGQLSRIEQVQEEKEAQPECNIEVVLPGIEFIGIHLPTEATDDEDMAEGFDDLMRSNKSDMEALEHGENVDIRDTACQTGEWLSEGQLSLIEEDKDEKEEHPECSIEVVLPGIDFSGIHLPMIPIDDDDVAEGVDNLMRTNMSDVEALEGIENDGNQTTCQSGDLMPEGQFCPLEEDQEINKEQPECNIEVVLPSIQFIETHLGTQAIDDDDDDEGAEGLNDLMESNESDMNVLEGFQNDGIRSNSCLSANLISKRQSFRIEESQEKKKRAECNIQVVLPGIEVIETRVSTKTRDDDVVAELDHQTRSNKSDVDIKNDGICSNSSQSDDLMPEIEEDQEEKEEQRDCNIQVLNSAIQSVDADLSTDPLDDDDDVVEMLVNLQRSKMSDMYVLEGIQNDGVAGNMMSEVQVSPMEDQIETEMQRECNTQVVTLGIQSIDTDIPTSPRNNDDTVAEVDNLTGKNNSDVDVLKSICNISCQRVSSSLYFSRRRKKMRTLADILKSQVFYPSRETTPDKKEFAQKSGVSSLENSRGDKQSMPLSRERKFVTRKLKLFSREERKEICSNKHLLKTVKPNSQNPGGVHEEIKRLENLEHTNANISIDIITANKVLPGREAPVCTEEVNNAMKENESSIPVGTLNGEEKVDHSPVIEKTSVLDDVSIEILELLQTNFQRNQQNSWRHIAGMSRSVAINEPDTSSLQHQKRPRVGRSSNPSETQRRKQHYVEDGQYTALQNQPIEAHLNLDILPRTDPCPSYSKINCLSGSISPNIYEYSPSETLSAMQLLRLVDPAVPLNVQHGVGSFDSFDRISATPQNRCFNSSTDISDVPGLGYGKKRKNKNHGSASQRVKKSTVKTVKSKEKGGADDPFRGSQPKLGFCALNMNPADFYTINRRSKLYMISYKDLIPVQTHPLI